MSEDRYWHSVFTRRAFKSQWDDAASFRDAVTAKIGPRPSDTAQLHFTMKGDDVNEDSLRWHDTTKAHGSQPTEEPAPIKSSAAIIPSYNGSNYGERFRDMAELRYPAVLEARKLARTLPQALETLLNNLVSVEESVGYETLLAFFNNGSLDKNHPILLKREAAFDAIDAQLQVLHALRNTLRPASVTKTVVAAPPPATVVTNNVVTEEPAAQAPSPEPTPPKPAPYPFGVSAAPPSDLTKLDTWLPFLRAVTLPLRSNNSRGSRILVVLDSPRPESEVLALIKEWSTELGLEPESFVVIHTGQVTHGRLSSISSLGAVLYIGTAIPLRAKQAIMAALGSKAVEATVRSTSVALQGFGVLNVLLTERAEATTWAWVVRTTLRLRNTLRLRTHEEMEHGVWLGDLGLPFTPDRKDRLHTRFWQAVQDAQEAST